MSDTPIYGLDIIQDKPIVAFGNDQGDLFAYNFAAQMQISHFPKINKDFLWKVNFMPTNSNLVVSGGLDQNLSLVDFRAKSISFT